MGTMLDHRLADAAAALVRLEPEAVAAHYRPDVILDANVPYWRYQLQGPEAVVAAYREELGSLVEPRVTRSVTTPMEGGVVVELEVAWGAGPDEHLWREVHLLRGDEAGIVRHDIYCTGVWDADAIQRHAREAPMVEPWIRR